jgi:hypothetical protein
MTPADLSALAPGTPLTVPLPRPSAPRSAPTTGGGSRAWPAPVVGPTVLATAVAGDRVVVGGDFTYGTAGMPGGTFCRIALWDGTGWQRLGTGLDGPVRAVAVVGDHVYAGGDFTTAGGVPAARLARWDARPGRPSAAGSSTPTPSTTAPSWRSPATARGCSSGDVLRAGVAGVRSLAALDLATGEWSDLAASCGPGPPT